MPFYTLVRKTWARVPKARAASNDAPLFIAWKHARASLCATALIATICSVLAHFFWNQKNTIPPSATPFMRASSPATGLDVVRLTSATSVTLFVSP